MTLKTQIEEKSGETNSGVDLGKWTMIYVSFYYGFQGLGISFVHINAAIAGATVKTNTYGPSVFRSNDVISIGPGFTGQIRRVQIFSPAAVHLIQGNIF